MKRLIIIGLLLLISGCTLSDIGLDFLEKKEFTVNINWLGHAGFLIESNNTRIYINPFSAPLGSLKGDMIIATYSASDICSLDDINTLSKEDSIIVTPPECLARLALNNIIPLQVGGNYFVNGISVQSVDAYLINGTIDKGEGAGLIITVGDIRIYYTGITDVIPEMNSISDIDVLIFPIAGGELSMDMFEAIGLALKLNSTYNIPMYYGSNLGTSLDVGRQMKSIGRANGVNITLLHNGDLTI